MGTALPATSRAAAPILGTSGHDLEAVVIRLGLFVLCGRGLWPRLPISLSCGRGLWPRLFLSLRNIQFIIIQ